MRVRKAGTAASTTRYRHDGQMGIEDVETTGTATVVTRYGLGARGVDMIERTSGSAVTLGYPLYDAHGNNVASLTRSGTGYSVNDRRSYDAWGQVRAQQSAGDPKLRYCANLGHRQDDESGLIYMRARYYEPTSGRFVSEDSSRQGGNWFIYCGNNPIDRADRTGNEWNLTADAAWIFAKLLKAFGLGLCGKGLKDYAAGVIMIKIGEATKEAFGYGSYACFEGAEMCKNGAREVVLGAASLWAGKLLDALGEDADPFFKSMVTAYDEMKKVVGL